MLLFVLYSQIGSKYCVMWYHCMFMVWNICLLILIIRLSSVLSFCFSGILHFVNISVLTSLQF